MESETSEKRRPNGGHFRNYETIPAHKLHISIIFQEVIPRDKLFATHRAIFASKCVSNQKEMNFTEVREVFIHNSTRMKKILHNLHSCYDFGEISKIHLLQESCCPSGVTLGKLIFLLDELSK